jgi:hypothetical protein
MQTTGIALVYFQGSEQAHKLSVFKLIERRLESVRILQSADETHLAVLLFVLDCMSQQISPSGYDLV